MNFKCLNVKIDNLTCSQILQKLEFVLGKKNKKFHQIVTVNPEFILQAQKDDEFKNILNSEDTLNIADGIGIKFAAWRYRRRLRHRFAGVDLMLEILRIADKQKKKVFLIANKEGLSTWQETKNAINNVYPGLKIDGSNIARDNTNYKLLKVDYEVVFCALGAPYQEKLLYKLKDTNIKLAMGVGGSFDSMTGKIKRAPKWMMSIGLEWLWRLMIEPCYRLKRICNAVIAFPIKVIFNY